MSGLNLVARTKLLVFQLVYSCMTSLSLAMQTFIGHQKTLLHVFSARALKSTGYHSVLIIVNFPDFDQAALNSLNSLHPHISQTVSLSIFKVSLRLDSFTKQFLINTVESASLKLVFRHSFLCLQFFFFLLHISSFHQELFFLSPSQFICRVVVAPS